MRYRYENVCLETIACRLPEEIVTSDAIESRLAPLYSRLRLPEGRLELMTGIAERRFWPADMLPGQKSIETADEAIRRSGIERGQFGALVHGSVCRDYLEPATASGVHHGLGLPRECMIYDVSNACLGLLDGVVQVANMIELGQIGAGIVVGTESSRALVETTIRRLNADTSLSRNDVKPAMASLTIGSASAAIVLAHRDLSRRGNRLLGGVASATTEFCHLCRSGRDEAASEGMQPLMATDSQTLMIEGVAAAKTAFVRFCATLGWTPAEVDKSFCHQVGKAHRKLLLQTLGLDPAIDYATFPWLGNTGAAALPSAAALGIERGHVRSGDRVVFLGIGSGINVVMLGVEWREA
jgi:acyl-CoA:acyl-CoA alkyltransferase